MQGRALAIAFSLLTGCAAESTTTTITARLAPLEHGDTPLCNVGDTIVATAREGGVVTAETTADCSAGEVTLEVGAGAEIEARLLATRGADGLEDDVVIGTTTEPHPYMADTYLIPMNRGFARFELDFRGRTTCIDAKIADVKLELVDHYAADAQPSTVDLSASFACDAQLKLSDPLMPNRIYDIHATLLDAQGAPLGEGHGSVRTGKANSYELAVVSAILK